MVGTTAIQFTENTMHEFIEEYKSAHNMREMKGPGLGYVYEFRAQPKRPSPALPIAGCALAKLHTGNYSSRQARTSSQMVGSWWTDPVFENIKESNKPPGDKGSKPAAHGVSSNADYGSYFHDPELDERDPVMDALRIKNGAKRILPVETDSQFALEKLPTADRML